MKKGKKDLEKLGQELAKVLWAEKHGLAKETSVNRDPIYYIFKWAFIQSDIEKVVAMCQENEATYFFRQDLQSERVLLAVYFY